MGLPVITEADRLKTRADWAVQLVTYPPFIPGQDDYQTAERVLEIIEALAVEKYREQLVQLLNAAAMMVSHQEDIDQYIGGSASSAASRLRAEIEVTSQMLAQ